MQKKPSSVVWTPLIFRVVSVFILLGMIWGWTLTTLPVNVYRPVTPVPMRTSIGRPMFLQSLPISVHESSSIPPTTTRRIAGSDVLCLAQVLFFEAGTEPREGLEAVAAVVFNRMQSPLYPSSVCGVVYQPAQFSWTLDAQKLSEIPPRRFVRLAQQFLRRPDILTNAYWKITHFHQMNITPRWSEQLELVATYGHHKFYRF